MRTQPIDVGELIQERYRVLKKLGEGSMGMVVLVQDLHIDRPVAMKLIKLDGQISQERLLRFIDEAKCQARLQHPGVISVYDIGCTESGQLFFTMRAVQGKDFAELIGEVHACTAQEGLWGVTASGWSFRRLIQALRQCAEAVAFAHEQGVVHRDLKPQNLIIGSHGEPLVLDWGIAKLLHQVAPEGTLSTLETLSRSLTPSGARQAVGLGAGEELAADPTLESEERALEPISALDSLSELETIDGLGVLDAALEPAALEPSSLERASGAGVASPSAPPRLSGPPAPDLALALDLTPLAGDETPDPSPLHGSQAISSSSRSTEGSLSSRPQQTARVSSQELHESFLSSLILRSLHNANPSARASLSSISQRGTFSTLAGTITGTPAYMSPEQAQGRSHEVNPTTDVYALGCILYHMLAGRPPYTGRNVRDVLRAVSGGRFPRLSHDQSQPLPPLECTAGEAPLTELKTSAPLALLRVVERAMSFEQSARYAHAGEVAAALGEWLDGGQHRQEALEQVAQIGPLRARQATLAAEALALDLEAKALLREVPAWAGEGEKAASWALEERASLLREQIERVDFEVELKLRAALSLVGDLPEVHEAAAEHYERQHRRLAAGGRHTEARVALAHLEEHLRCMPEWCSSRDRLARYLKGDGALTLSLTSWRGAPLAAWLSDERVEGRRLRLAHPRPLGEGPWAREPLSTGRYVLTFGEGEERHRYPIHVPFGGAWTNEGPSGAPHPLRAPPMGAVGEGEALVPAGWCAVGDRDAPRAVPPARVWVDDFVVRRHPVTHGEYLEFLNDLYATEGAEAARRHAPQELGATAGALTCLLYSDTGRALSLQEEGGHLGWTLDRPVVMVSWWDACAYAAWLRARSGLPWRLLTEWEWEKAARGVDGRSFPWGDFIDPSWCCNRLSHAGAPGSTPVGDFAVDQSPYGVFGMAGNVADWCLTPHLDEPPMRDGEAAPWVSVEDARASDLPARVAKGGAWDDGPAFCHTAVRHRGVAHYRRAGLGFRVGYSVKEAPWAS